MHNSEERVQPGKIQIRGARVHNLKNIDVEYLTRERAGKEV